MDNISSGIHLISIGMILWFCLLLLFRFLSYFASVAVNQSSQKEKERILKTSYYEKMNIKTIAELEQFNERKSKSSKIVVWDLLQALIVLVLATGLWGFNDWARWTVIIFFLSKLCEILIVSFKKNFNIKPVNIIVWFVLSISIVWYLMSPAVRGYFH